MENGLIFNPYLPYNTANDFGFGHCSPGFHGLVNLHPHQKNPGLRAKALLRETNKFFISPSQGLLSGEVGRLVRTTKARRKGQSVARCWSNIHFFGGSSIKFHFFGGRLLSLRWVCRLNLDFGSYPPVQNRPLPRLTTRKWIENSQEGSIWGCVGPNLAWDNQ